MYLFPKDLAILRVDAHFIRGAVKEMSRNVGKVKNDIGYFEKWRGGGPDFQIFPKFKCMKYGFDFYNILVIYW